MFTLVIASLSSAIVIFYVYRKFICHRYFKKLGIPGPEPHFLFGNMLELWVDENHLVIDRWTKQYGDIYGYFEGSRPVLVVTKLSTIENVCIKQATTFNGRLAAPFQPDSDREPDHPLINMMIAKGERWRKPRMTASKYFSTIKMRTILPFFQTRIENLLSILEVSEGRPVDVSEPYERFAMDSLAEAAFGLKLRLLEPVNVGDFGRLPRHPVFENAREMMSNCLANTPFAYKLVIILPKIVPIVKFLVHFVMKYSAGLLSPFICFFKMMTDAIENEKKSAGFINRSAPDLLQLLMSVTKFSENEKFVNSNSHVMGSDDAALPMMLQQQQQHPERYMTERELKVQLVMFFLSGYETTSLSLSFLSAILAMHADVQEKLVEEINRHVAPGEDVAAIDYDTLMLKMTYLDCVCFELLRLYPVAINAVNRLVSEEADVSGMPLNQQISKVLINVWSIHQDAEHWGPDADKFWPERFLPENTPSDRSRSAFLSFGLGPHQCIGKTFSLLEMKYVIVNILRRYKISTPSNSNHPKQSNIPVKVAIVMTPKDPIELIFTKREI